MAVITQVTAPALMKKAYARIDPKDPVLSGSEGDV
jgi:hypothetical protein